MTSFQGWYLNIKKGNKNSSYERNVETNGRKMAEQNKEFPWSQIQGNFAEPY